MTMPTLSQQLLDPNRDVWDAMQAHRFVQDVAADRLPPDVFARYLVFEHGFVETAMLIFGHALLKAPGPAQRRRLIGVLHALAEEQVDSFRQAFAALGIAPRQAADAPLPEAVRAFECHMLAVAETGNYHDILAVMLAAEWMYATWCSRVDAAAISSAPLRRWVALHAAPEFLEQAAWLRAEVDIADVGAAECRRLTALFRTTLLLEIDFHEAAYDASWPVPRQAPENAP